MSREFRHREQGILAQDLGSVWRPFQRGFGGIRGVSWGGECPRSGLVMQLFIMGPQIKQFEILPAVQCSGAGWQTCIRFKYENEGGTWVPRGDKTVVPGTGIEPVRWGTTEGF